ncbi:SusC/RagA family TonB-linked outer membrane protein [Pseudobacter ginsenosidimutans]|nr:SusC/RagA family TonB-linked outer membrane protein [Pseudobacter ginsenosidimutans]
MTKTAFCERVARGGNHRFTKTLLVMKLTLFLLLAFSLQISAKLHGQSVSFSGKGISLESIFPVIKKQTGYVVFCNAEVLKAARPVTIEATNMPLEDFLESILDEQPLQYAIKKKTIIISKKSKATSNSVISPHISGSIARVDLLLVRGIVCNEKGEPLAGANIMAKGSRKGVAAAADGSFSVNAEVDDILFISSVGYEEAEIKLTTATTAIVLSSKPSSANQNAVLASVHTDVRGIVIVLKRSNTPLDEVQVIAYGTTTRRFNTSSMGRVASETIARQPVSNPLAALQGRIPGLDVSLTNGVPGSAVKVRIRGTNSLTNGSEPLYIVDGVPLASGNTSLNRLGNLADYGTPTSSGLATPGGGLSPFQLINPAEIESIEVLKDADATTIYGSRGANGVILITTKKTGAGKLSVSGSFYQSIAKATRFWDLMDTKEYVAMRKEAFRNDNVTPNKTNAYDLLLWDTTSYTNWQRMILGGTARASDANIALSGGNALTQFYVGAGYRQEKTVLPADDYNKRATINSTITQYSANRKLSMQLKLMYASIKSKTPPAFSGVNLPPNAPAPFDADGNLNWGPDGGEFDNPFAILKRSGNTQTDNLIGNLQLSYAITPDLKATIKTGYNAVFLSETNLTPISSFNPKRNMTGSSSFANSSARGWNMEPMLEYKKKTSLGSITILLGSTWQHDKTAGSSVYASGYVIDDFLTSMNAAKTLTATPASFNEYKYAAVFGRINYILKQKYVLNLSARRDGSSRFGDGNKYSNFGAVGVAWLFTEEPAIKSLMPWLSFGKLRGSYGTTGNDQIGDYRYLDTWILSANNYENRLSLSPNALFNGNYNWERNKKLEIGLEYGLFNNRIMSSIAWYLNRSDNQLVQYKLPIQTGFTNVIRNFPALIENSGVELELSAEIIKKANFKWDMGFNITFPKNRLVDFPGLSTSSYATTYVVGKSVNIVKGYLMDEVDPATGVYIVKDMDGDGRLGTGDRTLLGKTDPDYFGGINNSFTYKNFRVQLFFEFKQKFDVAQGRAASYAGSIGMNYPRMLLDRWQEKGDQATYQRYTQGTGDAYTMAQRVAGSNLGYADLTYLRLRNFEFFWDLKNISTGSIHSRHYRCSCVHRMFLPGTVIRMWTLK